MKKKLLREALIFDTVRIQRGSPDQTCNHSLRRFWCFRHRFTHRHPIGSESPESFRQPISLPPPAAFVLPIPLSPIKAELNLLRGPNRCVLFLQQFEMITQLLCLSVTSCDDRHCNRAGEIVFFHSSTSPPPPDSLPFSPPPPRLLPPQQSSHSLYLPPADGMGVPARLKTPHYQRRPPPTVPGTHPFPSPLLLDGQAHLQDGEERRT